METKAKDVALSTYNIDPSHSQIEFKVKHLGFSKVTGGFEEFEGHFILDPDNLETLEAEATIDAASIDTGEEERDTHLRSDDFFAVDSHPELRFETTDVKEVSGNSLTVTGELTIRGVTQEIELDVTYLGEAKDPWGGERAAFEATGSINRKDFGLTWNKVLETGNFLVGEKVELTMDVQGVKQEE
jgi:polyisoprenoid-binding protein YceI